MVELAIADNADFRICDNELRRSGPSYTVDTLEQLRAVTRMMSSSTSSLAPTCWLNFTGGKNPNVSCSFAVSPSLSARAGRPTRCN